VFLGWGVLGAVAALLFHHAGLHDVPPGWRELGLAAAGYAALSLVGLAAESIYAWVRRNRNDQRGRDPRPDRLDCHLVHTAVDSYVFADQVGKGFDPTAAFQGRPPAWPAQIVPPSFVFAPGEAYRDVELRVDAPDGPGAPAQFNVNVWQGGVPSGGATFTITRGGP
jgi:hypothetical protein